MTTDNLPATAEELRAAAARGAAWLDRVRDGWWESASYRASDRERIGGIELDDLDMGDPWQCVGGQLEGRWGTFCYEYQHALAEAVGGEDATFILGLDSTWGDDESYATLTEAWKGEIRRRRREAPSS
jgi:hypothetical protein